MIHLLKIKVFQGEKKKVNSLQFYLYCTSLLLRYGVINGITLDKAAVQDFLL